MSKIKCCDKGRKIYNYDGLPAQYCTKHRLEGMVNVVTKRCAHEEGCGSPSPNFNFPGMKGGVYCKKHRKPGMVDVKHKRCVDERCTGTRPTFNFPGSKQAEYCKKHRKPGMENVVDTRRCADERCEGTRPSFNFPGSKGGVYCYDHKKPGMVNVVSQRCAHEEGCGSPTPSFNFPGMKGEYCEKHRKPGMENVKHKRCADERCEGTIPSFNFPGLKGGVYCEKHQKPGMVDVVHKRCADKRCEGTRPSFNFPGSKGGVYCYDHKKSGMVNVVSKLCISDWCDTQSTKKYDWYCVYCYVYLFPDKPISKNYKTKEKTVVDFVKTEFSDMDWVCNRRIQDGCSRRQPDLMLDLGFQVVIIEVDENQHRNGYSCENKRVMELSLDVGHRPIVFIRFNPDSYKIREKVVKSCWGVNNRTHTCRVNSGKKQEWSDRLDKLCETIEYWKNTQTLKTVETIHLFYDEC
jgi:hypothetical protein